MVSNGSLQRLLNDVHQDYHFRLANGSVLKNLRELDTSLDEMQDEVFSHHVNDQKHDFSNLVRDVIKDEKLAENLQKAKDKREVQITVMTPSPP